jgi:hypothetical protein
MSECVASGLGTGWLTLKILPDFIEMSSRIGDFDKDFAKGALGIIIRQ